MVDYILDEVKDDFMIVQGIRGQESESRSKMQAQCNYFKYYKEPLETNTSRIEKYRKKLQREKKLAKIAEIKKKLKKAEDRLAIGKEDPKYLTYRRKEVLKFMETHATDVFRPVFEWTGGGVIQYILDNGIDPNPLYKMGMKRVGCFPCIMAGLMEIHQLAVRFPERIEEIAEYEKQRGSSFFASDTIPKKFYKGRKPNIIDIVAYAKSKHDAGELFEEYSSTSCMSYYGLCER